MTWEYRSPPALLDDARRRPRSPHPPGFSATRSRDESGASAATTISHDLDLAGSAARRPSQSKPRSQPHRSPFATARASAPAGIGFVPNRCHRGVDKSVSAGREKGWHLYGRNGPSAPREAGPAGIRDVARQHGRSKSGAGGHWRRCTTAGPKRTRAKRAAMRRRCDRVDGRQARHRCPHVTAVRAAAGTSVTRRRAPPAADRCTSRRRCRRAPSCSPSARSRRRR